MKFKIQALGTKLPELLILPIAKGNLKESLQKVEELSGVSAKMLEADFEGDWKKIHSFYGGQDTKTRFVLLGLGEELTFSKVLKAFRVLSAKMKDKFPKQTGVYLGGKLSENDDFTTIIEAACNGCIVGTYKVGLYKTDKAATKQTVPTITILLDNKGDKATKEAIERGRFMGETQIQIMDLMNAPANKATPKALADWAKKSAKDNSFQCKVLDKKQIEKLGLGALIAVNRGSEDPPFFIIMEHKPKGKNLKKVGILGKGITFDTGGLSIKGSQNMHYMKSDMGGAAAVLGTMQVAAKLNLPLHLIGIVPTTDNCVDAKSVKPGDVIDSYSGKTIEIIDTDAEGRLILADGIAYMNKHFKPEIMIDLATLTGSCVRTLGYHAGGLFTNNDTLANQLLTAGDATGERLWRLPLWDEYKSMMDSDVADIKNFSGTPLAGATTAGIFLEAFTEEHGAWAHLDIAGVAFGRSELSKGMSGTAYGIRLLIAFLSGLSS